MNATPRHVVLIMTDTQRFDMLGCYGYPDMKTPALDRLAAQGVRFDKAYTCQPVCGPARSAIFTGLWPHTNGVWANALPLGQHVRNVGQRLNEHEVKTAYIGKWHLDAGDYFGHGHAAPGWDAATWYDMRDYLEQLTEAERVQSRRTELNQDPNLTAEFTFGHRCSDRAIEFIQQHARESFLLVVSYDEPHGPCLCPRPYSQMYHNYPFPKRPNVWDTLEDKPEHQRVWAGGATAIDRDKLDVSAADYLGCNSFVDFEIGRVIDAIDQHIPNALIIYTSDHGDAMQSHCINGKGPIMYEEVSRIPLIVRWPGHAAGGQVCAHPVSHIDLTPTILDAFALPAAPMLEGASMLETFADAQRRPHEIIFMEFGRFEVDHDGFGGFQPARGAFDGRYKLVVNLLTSDELYDLATDPYEMTNLIEALETAAARDHLHDAMLEWMNRTRDPFRGYYWERRPWRADASAATWSYTSMTRQRAHESDEPPQLDYDTGLEPPALTRKK
jgi:uncharacterized sulfatase